MRRSGFARPVVATTPPAPPTKGRGGAIARVGEAVLAVPKSPAERNQAFRDLARGEDCVAMIYRVCNHDPATVVLAHTNTLSDQKGMGYKGHDSRGFFACSACHSYIDERRAESDAIAMIVRQASIRMDRRLREIADNPAERPWRVAAARWAIERREG